jgi:hypothetical protein
MQPTFAGDGDLDGFDGCPIEGDAQETLSVTCRTTSAGSRTSATRWELTVRGGSLTPP